MREHDRLCPSLGPRREDDHRGLILVQRDRLRARCVRNRRTGGTFIHLPGSTTPPPGNLGGVPCVRQRDRGFQHAQGMVKLALAPPCITQHGYRSDLHAGPEIEYPVRAVPAEYEHAVTPPDTA